MDRASESLYPLGLTDTNDFPYIDGQDEPNGTEIKPDDLPGPPTGGILQKCGCCAFPWLLILSVVKLAIFLNKLYHDCSAVGKYFEDNNFTFCIISASCLLVPAFIYIMYVVSLYVKEHADPEGQEVGTKIVHGLLLVPWQIKSRVEVLQFSAQRVCHTRNPTPKELEVKSFLDRQAAVLEFFPAFYAGLTQLLLQLYIIIVTLDQKQPYQALTGQIIASVLTLMSMMAAVRRRDDGILTTFFSTIAWMSIMVSRAVAIALAATILQWWMVPICVAHGLVVSVWITFIAARTYDKSLNKKQKTGLYFLIFSVFGLPSIIYWPLMFELKKNWRPLIYLTLLLLENICLILLWAWLREDKSWHEHDIMLLAVTTVCFVVGVLFISFYICCKPKYTDYVVYHDMKIKNADSFGMYFVFCDAAFKLKQKEEVETHLKEIREQRT